MIKILILLVTPVLTSFWSDMGLDIAIHKNSDNKPISDGDYLTKSTFYSNVFLPTFSKLKALSESLEEELEVNTKTDMIAYGIILFLTIFMIFSIPVIYCIAKKTKEKIISKSNWPVVWSYVTL